MLHDVLEDCEDTSYADLEERFGQAVASTVLECSDDKRHAKVLRKAEAVSKAPRLSEAAALVTLADKLHNLQSMAADGPPQGWSRDRVVAYAGWASEVAAPLGSTAPRSPTSWTPRSRRWGTTRRRTLQGRGLRTRPSSDTTGDAGSEGSEGVRGLEHSSE